MRQLRRVRGARVLISSDSKSVRGGIMVKEATLTYENPKGEERVQELDGEVFRIGRYEGNDLAFDNPYISRYHAEITVHGSAYQIRDLGSTSGTFVNGERIKQRNLRDGDSIRLGRGRGIELVFHGDSSGEDLATDPEDTLQPVHVVTPEDTRFLNTSRLPHSGELTGETVDSLRALYEFMSELLAAHSAEELSDKLAQFMHRTLKAERCAVLLYDREVDQLELAATCDRDGLTAQSHSITGLVFNDIVSFLSIDGSHD